MAFVIDADAFSHQVGMDMESARLSPLFQRYYQIRGYIPIWIRQLLQRNRNKKIAVRDGWFFPNSFMHRLESELRARDGERLVHPWPHQSQYGFVLTHDVETQDGLKEIVKIAEIEESFGFRSSWSIVPASYRIDMGLIRDLVNRGFEIAIHGYNHDGRLFLTKSHFRQRLPLITEAIKHFSADGFRAPMVHRNLQWLQELDIGYDASCFDIDPYQAMPGGVGSIWPFVVGKFVELPYTMPQDHTIRVTLRESGTATWRSKLDYLRQRSGMVLMLTHPDYMNTDSARESYRSFLEHVKGTDDYWHALPRDVALWWRDRDSSHIENERIVGPASDIGSIRTLRIGDDGLRFC